MSNIGTAGGDADTLIATLDNRARSRHLPAASGDRGSQRVRAQRQPA
jgi:hypothetical protein